VSLARARRKIERGEVLVGEVTAKESSDHVDPREVALDG
jgi:hypothetical protein